MRMILKQALIPLTLGLALCSVPGMAQGVSGGFTGPTITATTASPSTVSQVKDMVDDQPIVLHGRILHALGKDKYTFQDDTGTITIKIGGKTWKGATISPEDQVEIGGEVDKDRRGVKIDVDWIRKL